jgi:hypothetical protein
MESAEINGISVCTEKPNDLSPVSSKKSEKNNLEEFKAQSILDQCVTEHQAAE